MQRSRLSITEIVPDNSPIFTRFTISQNTDNDQINKKVLESGKNYNKKQQ